MLSKTLKCKLRLFCVKQCKYKPSCQFKIGIWCWISHCICRNRFILCLFIHLSQIHFTDSLGVLVCRYAALEIKRMFFSLNLVLNIMLNLKLINETVKDTKHIKIRSLKSTCYYKLLWLFLSSNWFRFQIIKIIINYQSTRHGADVFSWV